MPGFDDDGVAIYYEEYGQGFPILTFAPGGLLSTIAFWSRPASPVNPTTEFAGECVNERVPYGHKVMDDAPELHERVLAEARKLTG